MKSGRNEILRKCRGIRDWFNEAGIELVAITKLRKWKPVFRNLSEKQFGRWIFDSSTQGNPRRATQLWIREFHRCISQNPDGADRLELERIVCVIQLPAVRLPDSLPTVSKAPDPAAAPATMEARELCDVAIKKARQGLHDSAWRGLKMEFEHYAGRDLEFAMALAPTLVYLAYRYFSVDRIGQSAATVLGGLENNSFPFCSDTLRNLCIVQLCTALSEHGQGKLAEVMLNKHEINALLNAQLEVPWPKAQIIRAMAMYQALHKPTEKQTAFNWVDRAKGLNAEPSNRRACSAVRYTIHMRHGDLHESYKDIMSDYERSRKVLLNAAAGAYTDILELLQVANDLYLGTIARSLWDDLYDAKQKAEDLHCLNWALDGKMGVANQEMDDEAMGIPMHSLPDGLQLLRGKLLRKHFQPNSKALNDVVRLIKILTNEKDP